METVETIIEWKIKLSELIKAYEPLDFFNSDQLWVFWRLHISKQTNLNKDEKWKLGRESKERIFILVILFCYKIKMARKLVHLVNENVAVRNVLCKMCFFLNANVLLHEWTENSRDWKCFFGSSRIFTSRKRIYWIFSLSGLLFDYVNADVNTSICAEFNVKIIPEILIYEYTSDSGKADESDS